MSRHVMPFGAEIEQGRVRFRFWAPGQQQVALALPERGARLPMEAKSEGWFELVTEAAAGEPYLFALADGTEVADPAARAQAEDAIGPSLVVDPLAYRWRNAGWCGRPWAEAVIYELHVGTFTPEGTFKAAIDRLPYLKELGVTAVELMPLADFPGRRNWGYDGVLLYAPDRAYGTPDDLKALIDAAHGLGLMVLLDVVYNHFGPEGNFLSTYAPAFFTEDFHTPWGAAIDFRQRPVRDFYVHNALYWLEEYRFDGLRLDAVHAIVDPSDTHILQEIGRRVRQRFRGERAIHLVLENEHNQARFLRRDEEAGGRLYEAQWNDDLHHVLHVLLTGETAGYYTDYAEEPATKLARGLGQGFVYQGEPSRNRKGAPRGEPSADLPPLAFVDFLQNHDQIGNRALGERISHFADPAAVRTMEAILLLSPHVPLLFMGEEWGASTPFLFFCDLHGELAEAVRQGRRREFAAFFADPAAEVPDPLAETTFARSRLDWGECQHEPHSSWLAHTRELLRLRADVLAPRLSRGEARLCGADVTAEEGLSLSWAFADGSRLTTLANLGPQPWMPDAAPRGRLLHATFALEAAASGTCPKLPPWSAAWYLAEAGE
jgi:maltooligosyltrehalose trehalohydrolase